MFVLHLPADHDRDPVIVGRDHAGIGQMCGTPIDARRRLTILRALATQLRSARLVVVALTLGMVASACGVHGLSFLADDRVDIVSPGDRAKVDAPVTVRWTAKNFATGSDRGAFGVVVDRAPQRSGRTLASMFNGDDTCKGSTGRALCATPEFLAERGVYMTTDTSFTIERIARLSGNQRRRQFHEATIVLLDAAGRRLGEGAWSVQFELAKEH